LSRKLIYGVGINDLDYVVTRCPFYNTWLEMLRRGFSEREKERHPTYKDTTVCEEWKTASVFKAWMEKQNYEGLDLDKDILIKGNNVYSPETTVFVPSYINTLLVTSKAIRGKWPLGVSLLKDQIAKGRSKIFRASIKDKRNKDQVQKNLGHFTTQNEAHKTWQQAKYEIFMKRLSEYSQEPSFDVRVHNAMQARAIGLKLDIALERETYNI
jgi:hypothetical protein